MRSHIEKIVNRLGKHDSFNIDEKLGFFDIVRLLFQIGWWVFRGFFCRPVFKQAKGLIMIGCGVRIRYPNYLVVGKNFIIEDFVEVMALSNQGIVCGDNVTIGAYATIKPSSYYGRNIGEGLQIGDNSNIGRYSYIGCSGKINIGKNVMMGPRVSLFAENHNFSRTDIPMKAQGVQRDQIDIEDDCWLASGSIILAGVTIGQGTIVAAGSVVTKDVPAYSVVAGSPAKVIKSRIQ
jgi:acetyltransferase-like isoleucine patch superfamily enzyme